MRRIALSVVVCSLLSGAAFAQPVVISEIMANPTGSEFRNEFVELMNVSADSVDLTGWRIGDSTSSDLLVFQDDVTLLGPGDFCLIHDPDYEEGERPYGTLSSDLVATVRDHAIGSAGLDNAVPERVELYDPDDQRVHAITYVILEDGYSYELVDPSLGAGSRWVGGTPGRANSHSPKQRDLSISLLGAPSDVAGNESGLVRLGVENLGREAAESAVILVSWLATSETLAFGTIAPGESQTIETTIPSVNGKTVDYRAILQGAAAEDPENNAVAWRVKFGVPPGAVAITGVFPDPIDGPEWGEVLNVTGEAIDLGGWSMADASGRLGTVADQVIEAAQFLVLSEAPLPITAASVASWPALNNSGDRIQILDSSGTIIDEMTYAESLKGRSIERIAVADPSDAASNWLINQVDDGGPPGKANRSAFTQATLSVQALPESLTESTVIRIEQPETRSFVIL